MSVEKTLSWDLTPSGSRDFQIGHYYDYLLPDDLEDVRSWHCDLDSTAAAYQVTYQVMILSFAGLGDYARITFHSAYASGFVVPSFHAKITLTYSAADAEDEDVSDELSGYTPPVLVLDEPWSTMVPAEHYERKARAHVARTYRAWPFCSKHQKVFDLTTLLTTDSAIRVFLECAACEAED